MNKDCEKLLETVLQDPTPENLSVLADCLEENGDERYYTVKHLKIIQWHTNSWSHPKYIIIGRDGFPFSQKVYPASKKETMNELRHTLNWMFPERSGWTTGIWTISLKNSLKPFTRILPQKT